MISNLFVLFELEQSLLRKRASLTPQEKQLLEKCHKSADRSFAVGGFLGAAIAVAATWRGKRMRRSAIRVGAALTAGVYAMDRSQGPHLEEMLALDGSQLQIMLATVIMQKYPNNTSLMQLVSRHFYAEDVMDDSRSDSTVRKWRYRNFFTDSLYGNSPSAHGSQAEYGDSSHDHGSQADTHVTSISDTNDKEKDFVKSKHRPISNNSDVMDDPLDQVFGDTTPAEEIQLPSGTRTPSKEISRSHKRSHRRRRHRQREVSADWEGVQPQRI